MAGVERALASGLSEPFHQPLLATAEFSEPPLWEGDGRSVSAPGYYWGAVVTELLAAPASRPGVDRSAMASEFVSVAGRIIRSLRPWHNAGGLELRYVWGDPPGRLRVLLVGRALGSTLASAHAWARQMLDTVIREFPSDFSFGELTGPISEDIRAWMEIERAEEIRSPGPFVPPALVSYYYLVHPFAGDALAWGQLPSFLVQAPGAGFLSIALIPTVVTENERSAVDHITTLARHLSEPQSGYDYFGNQTMTPADAAAHDVLAAWLRFNSRDGVLVRMGVAGEKAELPHIAAGVASILTQQSPDRSIDLPNSFKLVDGIGEFEAWQTATLGVVLPRGTHAAWSLPEHEAPISVERMPYFFTEEEAARLFALPVPDDAGVPGIPAARRAAGLRESVGGAAAGPHLRLGVALHHGREGHPVSLSLAALNRHVLVVGSPGSGKTSTVMSTLVQLWRDHSVPFLVVESVLSEYRTLLEASGMEDLRVITLGNERLGPFRLNPLAPPPGVRCELHRGAVLASLKLALPLTPPLPQLLAKALSRTYLDAGWDDDTVLEDGIAPPTLRDLLRSFTQIFDQLGYVGEARNIGVAFKVRLESLLEGSRGKVLDTVSSVDFEAMLERPLVIEFNEIIDADERAVLAAFILDRVRSSAKRRGSSGGVLKHVTVIEEAHRLLARADSGRADSESGDRARADSVKAFCDAIAELRSLGEGFVLSSQSPSRLADAAVANTGTRIVHRMESATDRAMMLDDVDADERTRAAAASLAVGEAVLRSPERDEAELVRVEPDPAVDSGRLVSDDAVRLAMRAHRELVSGLLPYRLCSESVCATGCSSRVRGLGRSIADDVGPAAGAVWADALAHRRSAAGEVIALLAGRTADEQTVYCAAVHLSLAGEAFRLPVHGDHRATLEGIVREAVTHGTR